MTDSARPSSIAFSDGGAFGVSPSASDSGSEDRGDDQDQHGSKKRKRQMNVTCEACKQRKVKCDRAQPACGWCSRNDQICEYRERKKPGLRSGYGRMLESRLEKLEEIIFQQRKALQDHLRDRCPPLPGSGASVAGPSIVSDVLPSDPYSGSSHRLIRQVSDYRQSTPLINPSPRPSIEGSVSFPFQTPQLPMQEVAVVQDPPSSHYAPSIHSLTSPRSQAPYQARSVFADPSHQLPPYDLLYALVDLYFKQVNSWLPLLNRKTTLDALFGPNPLEEGDRILLHAMVATSLRFSQDPRLTQESKRQYHEFSKQRVQLYGLETSSVRALQALAILALDVTGTTNGPPGWNLLALISRSLVQLGLATESNSSLTAPMYPSIATLRAAVLPEPRSWIEDEERRRLFWTVYLLDRYATITTAFEFALDEKEIDRRLPCRDDLFSANKPVETRRYSASERPRYSAGMAEILGSFSYHCELLGILTRIHQFLKRPVDIGSISDVEQWQSSYRALDSDLTALQFSFPDDFANLSRLIKSNTTAKGTNTGWIMLHAAYSFTVIRLNSSAAYPSAKSHIFVPSYSAMQRCLAAVENIRQLCYHVVSNSILDKLGPPFAFALWVAARVVLVHHSTMEDEENPDIELFVIALSEMGQCWDAAHRYSEILNRVLEEYRQSQRSTTDQGERVTPSTVKILADMRRSAFDLDLLISRQPRAATKSYVPTRANTPAPNELEYLDVFDFFNFPRIPFIPDNSGHESDPNTGEPLAGPELDAMAASMYVPNFAVPDPETDWLFQTSYDNTQTR